MAEFDTGIWTIRDNTDWAQPLVFTDRNGVAYVLSGSTFRLDLKLSVDDVSPAASLTTGNGGIVSTDLVNGAITLNIGDFVLPAGSYVGDLVRISGSVRETLLVMQVLVRKGVTGL